MSSMPSDSASVYYAKWIVLPDGSVLNNGAIKVKNDLITALGPLSRIKRTSKDRFVNLGKRILLPGLINMHTHLEESVLRNLEPERQDSFVNSMVKKDTGMKTMSSAAVESAIHLGLREALANGITTLVDTTRTGISAQVAGTEPIRLFVIFEFHTDEEISHERLVQEIQEKMQQCSDNYEYGLSENMYGIAPYAFFSFSPDLHKTIVRLTNETSSLWACHMAESSDELQAFAERSGDLYSFLTRKRTWPFDKAKRGSLYHAILHSLPPNAGILYHCNYAAPDELSLLAAKRCAIVLCPQYSIAQGHKKFPLESALNRGSNLCLGTETPLFLNGINLFDELYYLKMEHPTIPVKKMLEWVTKNPARALSQYHRIGSLETGKKADMIGIKIHQNPSYDILEELLEQNIEIDFVMVNGEEIIR